MKLIDKTHIIIIIPGGSQSQGCDVSTVRDCASVIIFPQLDIGGCTPIPRKLSAASVIIALAIPDVALTKTGAIVFGQI